MNYKSFNLGDWISHISGVIEDETTLDGNEMRDLVAFLSKMPKWIPVSERLPESDVDVLTQYSDYSMSVDSRTASSSGWFWADGEDDLPIAWMPLPEPYEAESEEK